MIQQMHLYMCLVWRGMQTLHTSPHHTPRKNKMLFCRITTSPRMKTHIFNQ
jgi:hypothetical protein